MKRFVKEYLPYVLVIILVLLVKKFIVSPIKVNGDSMKNTLLDGDIMILNSINYKVNDIKRFDIVVVNEGNEPIIKRVIGLPGEEVEYFDNKLYINGKIVKDKYPSKETNDFKIYVKKGHYFVMGDNRTNSMDSRMLGSFPKNKILGRAKLTIYPFDRFGNKD